MISHPSLISVPQNILNQGADLAFPNHAQTSIGDIWYKSNTLSLTFGRMSLEAVETRKPRGKDTL